MSGFRSVVEDVAEVRVALGASDCGPKHAEHGVPNLAHVFGGNGSPEAGPAGSGIKLGVGAEKRIVAADAAINSFFVQVPILAGECHLGVGVAGDFESATGKLLAPLLF